ncbi:MAG: MmgE/PrpD family protein [Candidatus Hodarchaeota archaeon]
MAGGLNFSSQEKCLAGQLAKFATSLNFASLPEPVVNKVKQCTLDILGVFIAGSQMPWSQQVAEYVRQVTGRPESLVIGHGFRADVCNAAFANGTFGHSIEMDEQHNQSITHPSPVLMAVSLAVGERECVSGCEFIVALVAGYEIMTRVGMAVAPSILVERGFHPTSVTGTLGAAVAGGCLLQLTDIQMQHAISIAAMHSSGLLEYLQSGGEYKRVHPGMAAYNGIRSALLAKLGMTGPSSILEGPKGFLNAFSNKPEPRFVLDGLGEKFQILRVAFKPYACCRLVHSSIDAVTSLKRKYGFETEAIESITIHTCTEISKLNNTQPRDILSSQFSIPFGVALAVLEGSNLPKDYTSEALYRKDILGLAKKIHVVPDPAMDSRYPDIIGAKATVKLKHRGEVTEYVKFPKGEPENPMSKKVLHDKFMSLTSTMLSNKESEHIETTVQCLEELKDLREFTNLFSTE